MAKSSTSKLQHVHDRGRPLRELEAALVRARHARVDPGDFDLLRYALNLARIDMVPTAAGPVELHGAFGRLGAELAEVLRPALGPGGDPSGLATLVARVRRVTVEARARVLSRHAIDLDAASLDREASHKALVVVAGGGGGAGYVHAGAFKLIDDLGLVPAMIVGTSMGSVVGLFRAHRRAFDLNEMMRVAQGMRWNRIFGVPAVRNRYGLPATLRLFLRRALGEHFAHPTEDRTLRLDELEIPLRVVVAGLSRSALTHDVAYYEHLMDGVGTTGRVVRRQLVALFNLIKELAKKRACEVVLGGDALTRDFDALDAVGFSSAVPGLIHYDLWREDRHMEARLAALFAHYGLERLVDGGLVNNVPGRVAWDEVQSGAIGTRNAFILALDVFAPQLGRNLMTLPVQRLVRPQVEANGQFADLSHAFRRVLSPMELVPSAHKIALALRNGYQELAHERGFVREMMRPLRPALGVDGG